MFRKPIAKQITAADLVDVAYGLLRLVIVAGLVNCDYSRGDEPLPTVESVVEAWSKASRECRSFEAKLYVFTYGMFNERPEPEAGRYRFEAGGDFCLKVAKRDDLLRRGKELVTVDHAQRKYRVYDATELAVERKSDPNSALAWFPWLQEWGRAIGRMYRTLAEDGGLPLLILSDPAKLTSRYTLEVSRRDEVLIVKGVAKDAMRVLPELAFAFHDGEPLPFAVHHVLGTNNSVTYVLNDVRLNETPVDRDALMRPDLTGYLELRMDLSVGKASKDSRAGDAKKVGLE